MAVDFNTRLSNLTQQANFFQDEVNSRICSKHPSFGSNSDSYRIQEAYKNLQANITQLLTELAQDPNQDGLLFQAIDLDTQTSDAMNRFNLFIATVNPSAKFDYGAPLIQAKTAPQMNSTNVQLNNLLGRCENIRSIRGDGNCFVSALTVSFLENLIKERSFNGFINFVNCQLADGELKTSILNTVETLQANPSQLEVILADNQRMLPFVHFFRQLAAAEMKGFPEHYRESFVSEIEHTYGGNVQNKTYEQLVDEYVQQMGIDFSHPAITALCKALDFSVTIFDPRLGSQNGINILGNDTPSKARFCRNENHYFVLYFAQADRPSVPAPQPLHQIVVQHRVPFGHNLFIRGNGNGLDWQQPGKALILIGEDTWVYHSDLPLNDMEYKFLIDDQYWEEGEENRKISQGKLDGRHPIFKLPPTLNTELDLSSSEEHQATRITLKYDAGKGNRLTVRGTGPGLSWDRGVNMTYLGDNIWIWETQAEFQNCEFKILLNDEKYEIDPNRTLKHGDKSELQYAPRFQ
jgi:hypothetical protein